jgi:hypothetical protein
VSYRFDFGDGSETGPQASPVTTHSYAAGSWTARLTVMDQAGAVSHATVNVLVDASGPGANLVANPSFESSLGGWAAHSGSSLMRVEGGFDGEWALQITGGITGLSNFGVNDSPNWVLNSGSAGTRFRFTAWVRSPAGTGQGRLQIREYLGQTKIGPTTMSVAVPLSPQWQLVTAEHVTQLPATTLDLQVLDAPAAQGETFLVDNVAIRVVPGVEPVASQNPSLPEQGAALEFGVRLVPTVTGGTATLQFTTTRAGPVRIALFDASGRQVRTLLDQPVVAPGLHSLNFDAQGEHGDRLGPGVYFYRVQAVERSVSGRLVLLR